MEENIAKYNDFKKNFIDSITLTGETYNLLVKMQKDKDFPQDKIEEKISLTKRLANDFYNAFWDFKDNSIALQEAITHLNNPLTLQAVQKLQESFPTDIILEYNPYHQAEISTLSSKLKQQYQCLQNILKISNLDLSMYEVFFKNDYDLFRYFVEKLQDYIIFQSFDNDFRKLKQHSSDLNFITTWLQNDYVRILDDLPNIHKECNTIKENAKKLYQELELLRQGAISEGLTKRYTQEKKNNNEAKRLWNAFAIFGLFIFGVIFITPAQFNDTLIAKYFSQPQNTQEQELASPQPQSLSNHTLDFLKKSPVYLALIWFILFASRRRNEANRLASDYAHKEVFASSYEAYQEEIKKLKEMYPNKADELTELNTKLLDSMIGVLSDNPAKSLDVKKSTDELPAKELINFASEIIKLKGNK